MLPTSTQGERGAYGKKSDDEAGDDRPDGQGCRDRQDCGQGGLGVLRDPGDQGGQGGASAGTFSLRKTKARKGVNPKTGEAIKISAKKRMAFKPAAQVKDLLNPSK